MPVILQEGDWPAWLGEIDASNGDLKAMLWKSAAVGGDHRASVARWA
jgi:hypothetical protein